MRIAVTGSKGQVATSLLERAGPKAEVVALGRPAFDLTDRAGVIAGPRSGAPRRDRQRRRLHGRG